MRHWVPELHDRDLAYYNALKMDPYAIANRMPFSVTTIIDNLARLGLKRNPRPVGRPKAREERVSFKNKPNPLAIAMMWLGKRLVERNGEFRLDNRPTNLTLIMRETNRLLKAAGAEQLAMNPAWVVP
jgi:hypothetical protein